MKQLNLEALLDRVMNEEQLSVVFQPILSIDKQSIYAYEGLVRGPENSPLHSPNDLFDTAVQRQCLSRLDQLCCKTIIRRFAELRLPGCLFLNVDPRSFSETSFTPERILTYLQEDYIDPRRVVIEITETHRFKDLSLLEMALRRYRNIGLKLALDDLGSGYSGLTLWHEINPEFVKIDRHFIQNVHEDKVKRLFIKSVLSIADSLECEVIAEGIESKSEYIALRKLGLKLAQGYYFEKPNSMPNIAPDLELFSQRPIRTTMTVRPTAACLLKPSIFVTSDTRIENVGELFQTHLEIRSIPVVDKGEPLGLVLRTELMNLLASRFGRDLYGRKPVKTFINSRPVKLEIDMFLEDASKHITNTMNEYTEEFIITDNGVFVGMGSLLDLLRQITEVQINNARYANPLTLLPGNVLIQQTLTELLNTKEAFAIAYYDLDNFKAFNDVYGYGHGDEVIRLVGRLLQEFTNPDADFVGHIGGDDFIVLFQSQDWLQRCQNLLTSFNTIIQDHYSIKDSLQGFIESTDRFGMSRCFPIMTLSIGVVSIESPHENLSLEQIQELTSATKSKAKKLTDGSVYVETYADLPRQNQLVGSPINPHKPGFYPVFLPDTTSSRPSGEVRLF